MQTQPVRCAWVVDDPLCLDYHDREWGVPRRDERTLFEFLTLSVFQAGLSWMTILRRRENFRRAFDDFHPVHIAAYDEARIRALMGDSGILRNQQKIRATVANAAAVLELRRQNMDFASYLWRFVGGRPLINRWQRDEEIPAQSEAARALAKDMKARGFKFIGPTITYAFMQSIGMVNDHTTSCFRYAELAHAPNDSELP